MLRQTTRRLARTLTLLGFALTVALPPALAAPAGQTSTKTTSNTSKRTTSRVTKKPRYSARSSRARRLKLARARAAAARAEALRELQTPRYKLDSSGGVVPDVRAEAAIIYNPVTNEVLWETNSHDQRSIASMTKVMTAVVFLESNPDLTSEVVIDRRDVYAASTTYLRRNERVRVDDLLHLLLIASDNAAARALARISPHGSGGFITRMNEKAVELGLESTNFADPSGLDAANVASALDMARLITYASGDERIAPIMRKSDFVLTTNRRRVTIHNTNKLVGDGVDVRAGKTGFIHKAGYCLVTLLRLPQGDQVAVVVMGARSSAGRFWETRHLFNWLSTKTQELLTRAPQPQ